MGMLLSAPTQVISPATSGLLPTMLATRPNPAAQSTILPTPQAPAAPPTIVVPPSRTPANKPMLSLPTPARPITSVPPLGTLLSTYRGHSDVIPALAWSPDGRRIASASDDATVQVWQAS